MSYINESLAFDRQLPSRILDIEEKTRGNAFAWRGQFSPQLIESLLRAYCPEDSIVLDPFGGSGTVLHECASLGKEAHITEVNPAAWILSRLYEFANLTIPERKHALTCVKNFFATRVSNANSHERNVPLTIERLRLIVDEFRHEHRDGAAIKIFDATIVLLDVYKRTATPERVHTIISQLSDKVLHFPHAKLPLRAHLVDARRTPFANETFKFVITSPPYINVFNYHQNYRASTELLGWDLLKVARSEIGSNRANRGNRFLTVVQYCFDMGAVLEELHRVCHKNAKIIMIVGRESSVLGLSWQNSDIVRQIAERSGRFECVFLQERKFQNRFGATIYEDLLHLTPRDGDCESIKDVAETVARLALERAFRSADKNRHSGLDEALEKIPDLGGTPVFTAL